MRKNGHNHALVTLTLFGIIIALWTWSFILVVREFFGGFHELLIITSILLVLLVLNGELEFKDVVKKWN